MAVEDEGAQDVREGMKVWTCKIGERGCDSCGATQGLVFSPPHCAHFCERCAKHMSGPRAT